MALRITDTETCRLAAELAELTGETTASAIDAAVRERLEREQKSRGGKPRKKASVEELIAIADRIAKAAEENPNNNHMTDNDLYDEHGLPK